MESFGELWLNLRSVKLSIETLKRLDSEMYQSKFKK